MPNPIDQSAQAIADALAPSANAPSARWRWGTVKSVGSNGTMNVEIGGATVPGVRCAQHVMGAQVGDRVRVMYCGTEAIVDAVRSSAKLMSLPTISSAILLKDVRLDRDGTAPSSNVYSRIVGIQDKDGENVAYIQAVQYSDGRTGNILAAYNEKSDGTAVANAINVMVAKDGTRSYSVTAPAAFRDAIGLGAPYFQNYGDYVNLYCWGHIAILTVVKSVTLNGSWASADICTVPEAYRPSRDLYASATLQDISTGNIALYIGTNGVAQAKVRGGTSPGSSAHYVCGTLVWSY